ncbi:MAG: hypothetical protein IMW97_06995 [Firmicutes bacterium]|nr:hypothetical protein [Candidatus Fermentithermobacillaceae bacterium]
MNSVRHRVVAVDLGPRYGKVGFFGGSGEVIHKKIQAGPDFLERAAALVGSAPEVLIIPGGSYPLPDDPARSDSFPGVFPVNETVVKLARESEDSWHPRNVLAQMAWEYSVRTGCKALAVGTMTGGPLAAEAQLSGLPGYSRRAVYHALEHWAAIRAAGEMNRSDLRKKNLIVVYSGEETSVACHVRGSVVECTDPLAGEGPFGFRAAGTLPATALVDAFFENLLGDKPEELLSYGSGVLAYAGAADEEELERLVEKGDERALRALCGMAYQISKEIGRAAAALSGRVDFIILAGPAFSLGEVANFVGSRVGKWAPVLVVGGELVIPALLRAGVREVRGEW